MSENSLNFDSPYALNPSNQGDWVPETLTVQEIQKILKLGRNSVYNLVHSRAFPIIRVGNLIRIPKEPFYKWLSESHFV